MIDKRDLRLGNMFEQGIVCKINGRDGAKVHLYGKLRFDKKIKVINSVDVADLTPIPLTPKILVEWCGFKHGNDFVSSWYSYGEYLTFTLKEDDGVFHINLGSYDIEVLYLHQLQNLWRVLNKQELEIKG